MGQLRALYFRYFPIFALVFVIIASSIWIITWQLGKADARSKMQSRLANAGVSQDIEPLSLKGIPGRYDFMFEGFEYRFQGGVIQTSNFEFLTYTTEPNMAIIGFESALNIKFDNHQITISGHPLRASLEFLESEHITSYILEAKDGELQFDERSQPFTHLIFAFDETREERFGLSIETSSGEKFNAKAPELDLILEQFQQDYLQ